MSKRFLVYVFVFLFLLAFLVKGFAGEERAANLLIIVDSSNSMSLRTKDGKQRLEAVKISLGKLVEGLSGNVNVGMIAFGHRDKGKYGCKDIEMVIPIGPLDVATVKKELSLLQPRGVTPLSASLKKAATILKNLKGKSCILLMSDGEETCGGNPVKIACWIKEKCGIAVVVDVVGLNVTKRAQVQLLDIAAAGGGQYYAANSSDEIGSALTNVAGERIGKQIEVKKIGKEEGKRTIESARGEKKEGSKDNILGILILHHGNSIPESISIYNQETGEQVSGSHIWVHLENSYKVSLNSGVYRLRVEMKNRNTPLSIKNVVVKASRETLINIE